MVVGASYASAHDHDHHEDHDDHAGEFGSECVVCSIAAFSAAKISPDISATIGLEESLVAIRPTKSVLIAESSHANTNLARGPPLSFPSF